MTVWKMEISCIVTVFLILEYLVSGVVSQPESCIVDSDCTGYTVYNGIRCQSGTCVCQTSNACKDYGWTRCSSDDECPGFSEYSGITCGGGIRKRCKCDKDVGCDNYGQSAPECTDVLEVSGLGETIGDLCITDHYTGTQTMSVTVETVETNPNQNTGCSGITNTVSSSSWTLYRVFKESNFAVLEENIIASNEENDATYQIDNFNYHGVFVAKALVQYVDSNGVSNSSTVQGYFASSCAKTFEATGDDNYKTTNPVCQYTSQQIEGLGYKYSYELMKCSFASASSPPDNTGKRVICEGNEGTLSCSETASSTIVIDTANFGRMSSSVCIHEEMENTNCKASTSLQVVKGLCESKVSCVLKAEGSEFGGDPCSGTYKYLEVDFSCRISANQNQVTTPEVTSPEVTTSKVTTSIARDQNAATSPEARMQPEISSPPSIIQSLGCRLTFQCPQDCSDLFNPQEKVTFALDIGCSAGISVVHLLVRNCATSEISSCLSDEQLKDVSTYSSVSYKPNAGDLSWNYHGLFVRVYVEGGGVLEDSVTVKYGPVPEAGSCTVSPESGYALTTSYNITCTPFTVTGGLTLKYSIYTYHQQDLEKASRIFTGQTPNRYSLLLQPGSEASNFTVYIWVKAFVYTGASVVVPLQTQATRTPIKSQMGLKLGSIRRSTYELAALEPLEKSPETYNGRNVVTTLVPSFSNGSSSFLQVHPPSYAKDVSIVDLAESFVSVNEGGNSSAIQDMISLGNTQEATQLLGVITASLNIDVENKTADDTDTKKRKDVRTAVVSVLNEIPVNDFEAVSSTITILNQATEVKEEISEEAQDAATDLYSKLADGFDQFAEQQSTAEAVGTAGSILDGVTRILDLNTDSGIAEVQKSNETENTKAEVLKSQKIEKVKTSTVKLLNTVDTVTNVLMVRQQTGANASLFVTASMTVAIQKLSKDRLSTASYSATGAQNSRGGFNLPDLSEGLASGQDYGIKMLYLEKNPYLWDETARNVTAPVMSISLKDENSSVIAVNNLTDPVAVSLSNFGTEASSFHSFEVGLLRNNAENLTDTDTENVTFDTAKANMLSFNISANPGKTITLEIVPMSNITSLKMLIKTDKKPTLDEIIEQGFLYPHNTEHSMFARFEYLKTQFKPTTPEKKRMIYLTHNSLLSSQNFSGVYYIGLTLDLNHTETLQALRQNYSALYNNSENVDCASNDPPICKQSIEVSIDIQTKQLSCIFWNETNETWSSNGCEVSPYTTKETIECLCNHMTSFSGSVLVLPNFVDPIGDAKLFLTFFDNPVVVTAVIMVWIIYFFLIHWAKQADKKDKEKVGVINCADNNPTNSYIYLVCVVTGWWKDAGTSANVFIFLKGSKGCSSNHCLSTKSRPCFQTGSEDWYLVTTEHSLGDIHHVTLWHDNMGISPHWYLNHVYVKDRQLKKSWHFIYNDWLAVDRGAIMQTSATLDAVSEEEIKFKQKHNFMVKSTNDLRDGHIWLSIFSKPARSTFTRVQRLTCALSLILTTMLTNIMFYGIATDDPADQAGMAGGITISLSAIVIGIQSSLIMFPVNLLILQLFLKVKPKPEKHVVHDDPESYKLMQKVYEVGNEMTYIVLDNLMSKVMGPDYDRAGHVHHFEGDSLKSESLTKGSVATGSWSDTSFITAAQSVSAQSIKSSSQKEDDINKGLPKSSKFLPWWFLYIAWFLVITVSIVCSYFVMLYGLKYGYNKSVSWLVSFITGFAQSAFIQQPLKVIAVAVIITLIFKKPVEFEDYGPEIDLDEDEVYLHEVGGSEEIHYPTVQPLSKKLLKKIRQRLHVEWLMDMTLRDMILYGFYVGVVMFMVHGHRNVNLVYRNNLAIEDVLVNPGCIKLYQCFFLEKADSVERMFQYLEDVLIPSLSDMSKADHDYATPGSSHFLLGPFRLRQQRIQKGTCSRANNAILKKFGENLPECVGSYWLGDEEAGSFNKSWKKPIPHPASEGPWTHQSQWTLKTLPYSGIHATYSGGGYVLQMPSNIDLQKRLDSIKNTDWIDDRTRAVFAEFTLYNPNADLFSVVMIFFELTNVGGVFPSHQIFTSKLYHYSTDLGSYIILSEFLFFCFNIAFTYIEVKRYRKLGRREYFSDLWSYAEILQLALSYTVIGLFFQRMISTNSILELYRESQGKTFVSFYTGITWDFLLGYIAGFQVAVVTLKSVKLLRFNKRIFMISDTIAFAKGNLINFAFIFFVFMMAFGHFGRIAFGTILYDYRSFGTGLITLVNFALGSSDLPGMYEANRILGPIFFALFVFFSQWCFLTIFVAILNFGISDSKAKTEERQNKFELMDYMVGKMKNIL